MNDAAPVLARFDYPVAETETRLAILSDLHLAVEQAGTWRMSHRTRDRLKRAVTSINSDPEIDGVLFLGDLVQDGTVAQYRAFDEIIPDLDAPLFAVPGNHDLIATGSGPSVTLTEFEDRYTPDGLPYHTRVGGLDVLALNSNRSTHGSLAESYTGRLSADTLGWLEDKLATVESPLVAVHHNLPGTRSLLFESEETLPVPVGSPDFENTDEFLRVLREGGSPLVVTGHLHVPAVSTAGGVREFTLPSLGPYPCSYTVLDVGPDGTTARMRSVAEYPDRVESFVQGQSHCRVLLAAAQLSGLPLVDDFRSS